jgi:hypothetical protein
MGEDHYKPKVKTASLTRKKRNSQFVNPPSYAEMGGMTGQDKLMRGGKNLMGLEKGGPKAKRGKPF